MAIYTLPHEGEGARVLPDLVDADDEGFSSIYRTYRPALLAFCRSRLNDASEAEDACQEAFLRAYRSLPRFDRTQRLWPWLATIAANVCTDMRRKKQAVPLSSCERDPRSDRSVDLADQLDGARARLVATALRELPDAQQRELYMADAEGWTYADIAEHEHRTVPSVRTSLMRGRTAFKARAQKIAEDRGMWPLAVVPFARLRRVLSRTAKESTISTAAGPAAIAALQVAAAALVIVGAFVPLSGGLTGAGAATLEAPAPVSATIAVPDRVDRRTAATPPPAPAALLPIAAPAATEVDLEPESVAVRAIADVDADPDEDPTVLGGLAVNCRQNHRSALCEVLTGDDGS